MRPTKRKLGKDAGWLDKFCDWLAYCQALETAGGIARALPLLGPDPFERTHRPEQDVIAPVELAGALAEIARLSLRHDYHPGDFSLLLWREGRP